MHNEFVAKCRYFSTKSGNDVGETFSIMRAAPEIPALEQQTFLGNGIPTRVISPSPGSLEQCCKAGIGTG